MTGSEFSQWRKRLGWTQQVAAAEFNRSRATIIEWESRDTDIPHEIAELCRWKERVWRQRPEFGPVTLVWTMGRPLSRDAYAPSPVPRIELQACKNNQQAFEVAIARRGSGDFCEPFVTYRDPEDSDATTVAIFDPHDFRLACKNYERASVR